MFEATENKGTKPQEQINSKSNPEEAAEFKAEPQCEAPSSPTRKSGDPSSLPSIPKMPSKCNMDKNNKQLK